MGDGMLTVLRGYLAQLPGEVEKQVNLLQFGEIVATAAVSGVGLAGAVQQIIADSDAIFPDPTHRAMYVQSLTLLSNLLAHHTPSA